LDLKFKSLVKTKNKGSMLARAAVLLSAVVVG